jgi:sugar phosphate isomerase/epimerase
MKKLDVCIETFFVDLPWQERISRIAALGYRYVEIWHPEATFDGEGLNTTHPKNPGELRAVAEDRGSPSEALSSMAGTDRSAGARSAVRITRSFWSRWERMMEFADASGVSRAIIMPGTVDTALSETEMFSATIDRSVRTCSGYRRGARCHPPGGAAQHDGRPSRISAGTHTADGLRILRELDRPNVKLLYGHLPHADHGRKSRCRDRAAHFVPRTRTYCGCSWTE